VVRSHVSTRRTRRTALELAGKYIGQLKKGPHAGKYIAKVPNGRGETGKQLYKLFGPYAELERAVAARDEHLARQKATHTETLPIGRQAKAMTVREWVLDHWLKIIVSNNRATKTQDNYTGSVLHYILAPKVGIGELALVDLDKGRLEKWRNDLRAAGKPAPAINQALKHLRTALSVAMEPERKLGLTFNAARSVDKLPTVKKQYDGSPSDLALLTAAAGDSWLAAIPVVATGLGLRRGEISGLRWADIDFERRTVTFRWHVVRSGRSTEGTVINAFRPGDKTSADVFHTINLPNAVAEALLESRARLLAYKVSAGRKWKAGHKSEVFYAETDSATTGVAYVIPSNPIAPEAVVFPNESGDVYGPNALGLWFSRITEKAGVVKPLHGLRHDCGSFLLSRGVPLPVVSKHMRHANTEMTARVYSHQIRDDQRRAADAFDALLEDLTQGEAKTG